MKRNILTPFEYKKRHSFTVQNIGGNNVPRVIADLSLEETITANTLLKVGYTYYAEDDKWGIGDFACDYIHINKKALQIYREPLVISLKNYFFLAYRLLNLSILPAVSTNCIFPV